MTAKHTPGPWQLEIDTVFIGDKRKVQPVAYHMDSEGIANARLIAAAPELLDALSAIIAECDGPEKPFSSDSYLPPSFVAQARAAIAKATGQ